MKMNECAEKKRARRKNPKPHNKNVECTPTCLSESGSENQQANTFNYFYSGFLILGCLMTNTLTSFKASGNYSSG